MHRALVAAALLLIASGASAQTADTPTSTEAQDEDHALEVRVHGTTWASPRGVGDVRVSRELLNAAPHAQTSEMLSAAPGFFVDHEDGEGIGNDVYLRGFDLEHGSGIEMRVGAIPINNPIHIQGQGYADANFIIPEVLRSIRVLEGPYDPRQGDAAIVGSAYFELGVPERGYHLKASYGSFNQARIVAVAAPEDADEETFAAFALRRTDGFGTNRAGQSGSAMAQYALDIGERDHVQLLATGYGARSDVAGVVRLDDVDAGRIGYYGSYPYFASNQGLQSSRVILGVDFDHLEPSGGHFEIAPWFMWTNFRARQNFAGDLESSRVNPALSGLGDLFETANAESAFGVVSRFHTAPSHVTDSIEIVGEPGVFVRGGHTQQNKNLLEPQTLATWDRRIDAGIDSLDAGAYLDVDVRFWKKVRLSGGVRADFLSESIRDNLANLSTQGALPGSLRGVAGIDTGPRATLEYDVVPELAVVASYGEGFRSLDAEHLPEGASQPYSKVRSGEGGLRTRVANGKYTTTLVAFITEVGNELVFEATTGGLTTEKASSRRGVLGSMVANPFDWLLASAALSITRATFITEVPGVAHFVPNVPSAVLRADATVRGPIFGATGRVGLGYTLLAGRHLTDTLLGPTSHVLNATAGLRCGMIEVGVDAYNALGLQYADDIEYYVSNWSLRPGQQPASFAEHVTAAPPRTVLGSLAVHF
jgi:hypothetical protein